MGRSHTPILLVAGNGILLGIFLRSDFLSANRGKFEVPKEWEYPGGEAKPMRIYIESEGKLVFRGGFEYLNHPLGGMRRPLMN